MKTCWQKNQEALKENVFVSLESFHSAEVYCSLKVSHYRWHFSSPLLRGLLHIVYCWSRLRVKDKCGHCKTLVCAFFVFA